MSSEGHYCDYDFGGSDYLAPDEERRYLNQRQRESRERARVGLTMTPEQEQALKNAESRAEFLQQLADSHEQGMLERQGKIEALEKEQNALLSTIAGLKSEVRRLTNKVSQLEHQKSPQKIVIDYSKVDSDLLCDFAIAVLDNGIGYDGLENEAADLEKQIKEKATFYPHVQQEIVNVNGVHRFRMNELVNRLVEEAGNGKGLNYIASLDASVEDQAQLAQLIGYSVSGYQSLSYSLPVVEQEVIHKVDG